ncbi:MAG: homoaconitate hydratase family protein [Burkholderiales bacterium]|nr:MAG: homoaconitate hydratase family protein [Burkholderiales bacterium]
MRAAPATLAEKLIARAAGRQTVRPGEYVDCEVDLAMFHDSSGPRRLAPMLEALGARVRDPSKLVLVMDHYVPEQDDESRRIVRIARDWAAEAGLTRVHDSIGICHVVLPQQGHLRPGMFCVGGDSHSPTGGAFGAYMFGIGATEMLGVTVTGRIWLRVPETLRVRLDGRLADGVSAKDVMLALIGRLGMNGGAYRAVEFDGDGVAAMGMAERMTLCNMTAELGAQVGLVAPDAVTVAWLAEHGVTDVEVGPWHTDRGAPVDEEQVLDAAALAPQVALPHSPANARPVGESAGTPIQVAYVGACTGAKLEDLQAAARVLRGARIAAGVDLMVAPASLADAAAAERDGTMRALREAGARLLPTGCGACAGYGGQIPAGSTVISSTARNFRGRMGADDARVFLGSPYTVAASALRGAITDPREVMS